jgi:hypothetical protein
VHLVSDAADQRVGVSLRQIPEHFNHSQIGQRPGKNLDVLDLPRHYRSFNAFAFEKRNHLSELPDSDPKTFSATASIRLSASSFMATTDKMRPAFLRLQRREREIFRFRQSNRIS